MSLEPPAGLPHHNDDHRARLLSSPSPSPLPFRGRCMQNEFCMQRPK
jgi:hypothetical protein